MTTPLDWTTPQSSSGLNNLMPAITDISRPIIEMMSLWAPIYKIKLISVFETETRAQSALVDAELDKTIVQIEIHPMEMGHCILFSDPGPAGRQLPGISLSSIIEIKSSSQSKGILKRKDLVIEIIFVGNQNKRYSATIDVEDKYVNEIITIIRKLKELESNSYYWAFRSLKMGNTQSKTIGMYPNAPFLSEGEELLWKNLIYRPNYKDKILSINAITNYRVFQYDYSKHNGAGILLPLLEDVKVTNTKTKRNKNLIGNYSMLSSRFLEGIEEIINVKLLGDITFFSEGKPLFSFTQITDPLTLSASIASLKEQIKNSEVGYGIPLVKDEKTSSTLTCARCGSSDNSSIAKFCGQCGTPLSTVCSNCHESNPTGTKFCGHCGANL